MYKPVNMDWISSSVSKAKESNPDLPDRVVELLVEEVKSILSKRAATPREQAHLAKSLLAAMLPKDKPNTDHQ